MTTRATLKIDIWTDEGRTLPDDIYETFAPHAERVATLCAQGFHSGEIIDDNFRGWWTIDTE